MKAILTLLLVFFYATNAAGKCKFPAIFNFGDSNSDTGGFWAAFPAQKGPFGMTFFNKPSGRASDGRLVIDFFTQALGMPFLSPYLKSIGSNYSHGANFATLASTVLLPNTSVFVTGISPFSLAIQLNQMKEILQNNNQMSKGDMKQSLYIFDIGQNDFTGNLAELGTEAVLKQYMPQVASQISWTIKELYYMGARTFMVMNLGPIGCYPAFITQLPHNSSDVDNYGCLISYNNAVVAYNKMLKDSLDQVRCQLSASDASVSVVYVDTHSIKLDLHQHPKNHGMIYGTKACCGYGGEENNYSSQLYCGDSKVINGVNVSAVACSDPQNYVSWDGIHATEAANKLVATSILNETHFHPPFPLSKLCDLNPVHSLIEPNGNNRAC